MPELLEVKKGTHLFKLWEENFKDKEIVAFKTEDGKLFDIRDTVEEDLKLIPVKLSSPEGIEIMRHTTAHILAQAVKRLLGNDTKLGIGPVIENGFYYDIDCTLSEEELDKVEAEMNRIIEENIPIEKKWLSRDEAIELFASLGETYKIELIKEIEEPIVTIYTQAEFTDLCRGPHLPSTGWIKAFKLTSIAGAYWRGVETNPMLTRIYGVAFYDKKQLKKYLKMLEEAKKRDHRNLNRALDLYLTSPEVGAGLIIWKPNGATVRLLIEEIERKAHLKRGYKPIISPHLMKETLWHTSGHIEYYRENMYFTEIEGAKYAVKPMNCPAHILVYKSHIRSYRNLPIRYFEHGTVYRYERSGTIHGLTRVRGFTQDDAHIFCTEEQLKDEIIGVFDLIKRFLKLFEFDYSVELSTRPEKYIGTKEVWDRAESILKEALEEAGLEYEVAEGEGAFYGPKIDFHLHDALGRKWQGPTIQVDFNLAERFDLTYIAPDGSKKRPVMVHRTVLGSMERFIGVLTEHWAGWFPVWLAPIQAVIIPITENEVEYAQKIESELLSHDMRVFVDDSENTMNYKIKAATKAKIPVSIIIGAKEREAGKISIRWHDGKRENMIEVEEFIKANHKTVDEIVTMILSDEWIK